MKIRKSGFQLVCVMGFFLVALGFFEAPARGQGIPGVLTWHNDHNRDGQNLRETILTPQNVKAGSFGKKFSYPVDGQIYAQPLYVPYLSIPGQGVHNVVFVATENDSVYAFDADGLSPYPNPLWQVNFTDPANGITTVPCAEDSTSCNIYPVIGITGTPVIDSTSKTLYLIARTKEVVDGVTSYVERLHALDIAAGTEKFGGPVVIQASVPGTGLGSKGGQVAFNPQHQGQRPGLLLLNGVVYIAWAGWHGWVMGYNAQTLQQVAVLNTTPNSGHGGFWASGGTLAADSLGNIYAATADSTFDVNTGGVDYGDSVLKLSSSTLAVLDYFTPSDQACRLTNDLDLGSGGPMLLPPQNGPYPDELIMAGKGGTPCDLFGSTYAAPIYLVNRDNLGQYNSQQDSDVQTVAGAPYGYWSNPASWKGPDSTYYVYLSGVTGDSGVADYLKAYSLSTGLLSTSPVAQSSNLFPVGSTPSVSANGTTNGIVWAIERPEALDAHPGKGSAILWAYDATDVSKTLYDSNRASDQAGPATKFIAPTIVNGKVYVGTQTELDVYGLLQ